MLADTENDVYLVSEEGEIVEFKGSQKSENIRCFLDRLKNHKPNLVGTLQSRPVQGLSANAQWLSGIAAGAWFELHQTQNELEYRFRRISPYGHIDVDAIFLVEDASFEYHMSYEFVHYSNCAFFQVKQAQQLFRFERLKD